MKQALGNHVILNNILSKLSFQDLQNSRLVNTHWKKEANNVISKRNNCIIRIRAAGPVCPELEKLLNLLPSMSVPFIGLALSTPITDGDLCCSYEYKFFSELANNLPPLKYLELSWANCHDCASEFCVSLFKRNEAQVEELILRSSLELKVIFNHTAELQNLKMLRLKNQIHLQSDGEITEGTASIHAAVYTALCSAPRLREIQGIQFSSLKRVPQHCYDAIRALEYASLQADRVEEEFYTDFAYQPRKLTLLTVQEPPEGSQTLTKILQGSRETLKSVRFRCPSFVSTLLDCIRHGLDPLSAVENLYFNVSLADTTPEIRLKLAHLISYAFPNLRDVTMINCLYGEEDYDQLLENFWDVAFEDKIANAEVSRLFFGDGYVPRDPPISLEFLSEMFPNVVELKYEAMEYCDLQSIVNMWTAWPKLRGLEISGEVGLDTDFDAEFCGIFPQEAQALRSKPIEYLKNVVIVPAVRPAIYYLRDLKELQMKDILVEGWRRRKSEMLTEVTGFLAFRRMSLNVSITGDMSDQGLQRLSEAGLIHLDHDYSETEAEDEVWTAV